MSPLLNILDSELDSDIRKQTVVGVNAWVTHYSTDIFGPDAAQFKPERWLGAKEDVSWLESNLLTVGSQSGLSAIVDLG